MLNWDYENDQTNSQDETVFLLLCKSIPLITITITITTTIAITITITVAITITITITIAIPKSRI